MALWVALFGFVGGVAAGTACATNQTDWYTTAIGETPCMTFERLQRVCDPNYQVNFGSKLPGNTCNSLNSDCCCNSIAWLVSMLCFECQNAGDTQTQPHGIDAPAGTLDLYLNGCQPFINQSLPTHVQNAVCNEQIDLRGSLYQDSWLNTGDWFYSFWSDTMKKDIARDNAKNLTNCALEVPNTTSLQSSTPTPSVAPSMPSSTHGNPNTRAVVGGALGAVAALLVIMLGIGCWWRRRRLRPRPHTHPFFSTLPDSTEISLPPKMPFMSPVTALRMPVARAPSLGGLSRSPRSEAPPPYTLGSRADVSGLLTPGEQVSPALMHDAHSAPSRHGNGGKR